jgi:hypothetical protein
MNDVTEFTLDDGYSVVRLAPVRIHDAWHLLFFGHATRPITREQKTARLDHFGGRIEVRGTDESFERRSSGGHGGGDDEQYHVSFNAQSGTTVCVTYRSLSGATETEDVRVP